MYIIRYVFISLILFSNLSYSDDNNQLILLPQPKNYGEIVLNPLKSETVTVDTKDQGIFIMNFWATWCPPCIKEIPELLDLQKENANEIDLFFVSMDFNIDVAIPKFLKKNKFDNMSIFQDSKMKLSEQLKVKILPTTLIFDKSINEIARVEGYINWKKPENQKVIKKILSK
tara:strand:+ start:1755 stop:2270 length:516 start_codon:yes stop_codon:yes gene_type:complete